MKKACTALLSLLFLLTGCSEQQESEPVTTIPTEPVVYEEAGKMIIHAGYYGENKKVYLNKGESVREAEKETPDYEIETAYDYEGRKTEIFVYTYSGEERTMLKHETYAYDEGGNVSIVKAYDEAGNLLTTAEKKEDGWHEIDGDGNETEAQERDSVGNATTKTEEDGSKTRIFRNANNDILTKETYDKDGNLVEAIECTYTANDRLADNVIVKDGTGAVVEEYYLMRGNMRKDEMYNRYFRMRNDAESVIDIEDAYDEASGLIKSSVISNKDKGETIIKIYSYTE